MALPWARLSSRALTGGWLRRVKGLLGEGRVAEKGGGQLEARGSIANVFLPCRPVQILPLCPPSQTFIEALLWARHQGNQDGSGTHLSLKELTSWLGT